MKTYRAVILVLLASALVFAGCAPGVPVAPPTSLPAEAGETVLPAPTIVVPPPTRPEEPYPVSQDQVAATNTMGFDLLRQVHGLAAPDQNLFLSPPSVAMALAMVVNGAAGSTRDAILETLRLSGWEDEALNEAMAGLRQALSAGDLGVELTVANSLWGREGIPFRAEFLASGEHYYGARIEELDFNAPSASETINAWVAEQTRERILEIVPRDIQPETILYLINAIYFKGKWELPFRPEATHEQPFTRPDGSEVQAPMMSQEGDFAYGEGEGYQVVRLPYEGQRLNMLVVLPAKEHSVDELVASLDAQAWAEMLDRMAVLEGYVALPRFAFSFGTSLVQPLKAMGMAVAFDKAGADFSRLHEAPWPTWISDVRHKTFVEVNEEGTEAAAVTAIEVQAESMPLERFSFVADRPFLFAIQDSVTGSILFVGVLRDPLQTEAEAGG